MPATPKIFSYALTTVDRVKARLGIETATTGFDTLLQSLCNGVTDFLESMCDRHFAEKTYTDEVYSLQKGQNTIYLKNFPVSAITSVKYRTGLKSTPNWTAYLADEWELVEDGETGMIQFVNAYGAIKGVNNIQVTYTAGYKISWTGYGDAGDTTPTHTLPADLTDLAERMVVRMFNLREQEGKQSSSFNGANITWKGTLSDDDKEIIARYSRVSFF